MNPRWSSPYSVSPGTYTAAAGTTATDTTDVAVSPGHKIIGFFGWYGSGVVSSVSGGGLTWTIHAQSTGASVGHSAVFSADAPAGLASGTVITVTTASGSTEAMALRLAACDGLVANASSGVDGTGVRNSDGSGSASPWSVTSTTVTSPTVEFAHAMILALSSNAAAATSPAVEIHEWTTLDGDKHHSVYADLASAGAQAIGGSWAGGGSLAWAGSAVAFKAANPDPGYGFLLIENTTDRILLQGTSDKLLLDTNEAPAGQSQAVPVVTEADATVAVGRRKSRAVPTITDTETAQAIGRRKTRTIPVTTESDATQALARRHTRTVPVASEVDEARTIAAPLVFTTVVETDTAVSVGRRKTRVVPPVTDTSATIAVGRAKTRAAAPLAEVDSAVTVGRRRHDRSPSSPTPGPPSP